VERPASLEHFDIGASDMPIAFQAKVRKIVREQRLDDLQWAGNLEHLV